jgi:hypothetical protein
VKRQKKKEKRKVTEIKVEMKPLKRVIGIKCINEDNEFPMKAVEELKELIKNDK